MQNKYAIITIIYTIAMAVFFHLYIKQTDREIQELLDIATDIAESCNQL
jgi:hypothetical protein